MVAQPKPKEPIPSDPQHDPERSAFRGEREPVHPRAASPVVGQETMEPVIDRNEYNEVYDEPRTAPRPGPTTYQTDMAPKRKGVPLVTWVVIAIVALVVIWLLFTFAFVPPSI